MFLNSVNNFNDIKNLIEDEILNYVYFDKNYKNLSEKYELK